MNRPFVNGNREQTNNFTVDGLDVNETIDNRVAYQPEPGRASPRSASRPTTTRPTSATSAARSSAACIKSGTNQFRGNAFEFYRNSDFDANTLGEQRARGAPKQERRQHIYGGTLGGPLVTDKLFFFGDYQGSRQDAPGFGTASVAPEAWRRGDLSSVAAAIRDPQTGQPFPGNQIPVDRISAGGAGAAQRSDQLPAAQSHRPGRHHRQLRRRDAARRSAPTRATCASTGAPRPTTSSSAATRSPPTRTSATRKPFAAGLRRRATISRSTTSAFNWNRIFGPTIDQRGAGRLQPRHA